MVFHVIERVADTWCTCIRWLLKDEHGCLTKEKARGCIDGSIFYQLAAENENHKVPCAQSKGPKSDGLMVTNAVRCSLF